MNYKIQALKGYNMYFDQVASVFKAVYQANENITLDQLSTITCLNRSKSSIILNFLADLGLSQKRTLKGTRLGEIIFQHDDFLQKEGTLWLLHYLQSTNEYLIIWNRVMNHICDLDQFSKAELIALFEDLKDDLSAYTYKRHIGKEIQILLNSYIDQRLKKLNLLEESNGTYTINRNSDIPDLILLAAIALFRDKIYPGATAVNIEEVCNAGNSPGKIFVLDEPIIRRKLESLKKTGMINIESRGDLDQIRIGEELKFEVILERYYQEEGGR